MTNPDLLDPLFGEDVDLIPSDLLIRVEGTRVEASLFKVLEDASDTLYESIFFLSKTATFVSSKAPWTTYFRVRVGLRIPSSGNWELFAMPLYGGPHDETGDNDRSQPYYSRTDIELEISNNGGASWQTIMLDDIASAEVIANGQGIPPTVVQIDRDTQAYISAVEGHTLAFSETNRIQRNPNRTGFGSDGEYCLRFDHTIDDEGRETFYVAGSWPCKWDELVGSVCRGDIPFSGHRWGFSCGEEGPYARIESHLEKRYQIDHLAVGSWIADDRQWDNNWKDVPRETRGFSGITPFCLNMESRGADAARDLGYVWLLKYQAACQLQLWPSPRTPHTPNEFLYDYDSSAERGKGMTLGALSVLYRALKLVAENRDTTIDTEITDLRDSCALRAVDIFALLEQDYDNNSWLEGADFHSVWMVGHYFQGLLLFQETVEQITGQPNAKVQAMLKTLAEFCFDNTLFYTNGQPHPRDANTTYTGSVSGWAMDYIWNVRNPGQSNPISYQDVFIIIYEWLDKQGLKQGSKLDAIIAQISGVNYKWKLGDTTQSRRLFTGFDLSGVGTLSATATKTLGAMAAWAGAGTLQILADLGGGAGDLFRTGAAIEITDVKSIGDAIAVGPYINAMGTKAFTVVRGDYFKQPFTPTLDQGRTLDGTERWRATVRLDPTEDPVMEFDSNDGSIEIAAGTFLPSIVFKPSSFANVPVAARDVDYLYDLEMEKGGYPETYAIDTLTIRMDLSR